MNTDKKTTSAKIFYVNQGVVLALLTNGWTTPSHQVLRIPVNSKLPDDAKVRNCFYDPSRDAFGFVVEHDSYPEVENCFALPEEHLHFSDFKVKEMPVLASPPGEITAETLGEKLNKYWTHTNERRDAVR